jgi:hypothetical protein
MAAWPPRVHGPAGRVNVGVIHRHVAVGSIPEGGPDVEPSAWRSGGKTAGCRKSSRI